MCASKTIEIIPRSVCSYFLFLRTTIQKFAFIQNIPYAFFDKYYKNILYWWKFNFKLKKNTFIQIKAFFISKHSIKIDYYNCFMALDSGTMWYTYNIKL